MAVVVGSGIVGAPVPELGGAGAALRPEGIVVGFLLVAFGGGGRNEGGLPPMHWNSFSFLKVSGPTYTTNALEIGGRGANLRDQCNEDDFTLSHLSYGEDSGGKP